MEVSPCSSRPTPLRQRRRAGPAPGAGRGRAAPAAALTGALTATLTAILLAGCAVPQRLTLRDSNSGDAALLVSLRPAAWGRAGGPARGFEAGYQQYQADGPTTLGAGESLTLSGQLVTGPAVLDQKAKVVASHFGFVDRFYFGPSFELDVGVGGLKLDVDYELRPQSGTTGTQPFARSHTLPYGTITPRQRLSPLLALEARLAVAGALDRAGHDRLDAMFVITPVPQASLRLGYSWRRTGIASWSDPVFDNVDLRIRARGPAATLRLDF
ncbi:MAG: hypothetical protein JNL93_23175 [Pelomonas sp.]|nr:hypothetical protein [Roseateles sp.]